MTIKTLAPVVLFFSLIAVSCRPVEQEPASAQIVDIKAPASASTDENIQLRDRLVQVINELYLATPKDQQEEKLKSIINDRLAAVRLAGLRLAEQRVNANLPISTELRRQLRMLLGDSDAEVRQEAALLIAASGDAGGGEALLGRLAVEQSPQVREAILTSLGQLRETRAFSAVLESIDSDHNGVAAAAATALAKIVEKMAISPQQRDEMINALHDRYRKCKGLPESAGLREAIVSAMGVTGDKSFLVVLGGALEDESASVRLASVNAMAQLGDDDAVRLLTPLSDDPDRGVRQAVIATLGTMAGQEHLQTILRFTDASVEKDAAVRQYAWDVAMGVLAKADSKQLGEVLETLADNAEEAPRRIKILKLYIDALRSEKSDFLPHAQQRLAAELIASGLPAESKPYLFDAYVAYSIAGNGEARAIWDQLVDVLLATDDISVVQVLVDQQDDQAYASAVQKLMARLNALSTVKKWQTVIMLAGETLKKQAVRLGPARRGSITQLLETATTEQTIEDRRKVEAMVGELVSPEESVSNKAAETLQSMGDLAIAPLLSELRKVISADAPNTNAEKAILAVLRQIAPKLTGYDPASPRKERLELIEKWLSGK